VENERVSIRVVSGLCQTAGMAVDPGLSGVIRSLQVGSPSLLPWRGGTVPSAIVKDEVSGPVALGREQLDGDEQADLSVHGGPDKAVCCYAVEHAAHWTPILGQEPPPGAFGENLTLEGLTEDRVHIGDEFTVGTAVVQVSQPRGPCFKLAARWNVRELPGLMARGMNSGFYLRVLEPGEVAAGDVLTQVARRSEISVAEVMRVTYVARRDDAARRAVLAVPELAEQWRAGLLKLEARSALPAPTFGVEE